jgi:predicted DNA-binding protein
MPTKKPRVNVVLDPVMYKNLDRLAHREGVSLSLAARDLIKEGLELYEDMYWQDVAREREKTFSIKSSLSHKDIWES